MGFLKIIKMIHAVSKKIKKELSKIILKFSGKTKNIENLIKLRVAIDQLWLRCKDYDFDLERRIEMCQYDIKTRVELSLNYSNIIILQFICQAIDYMN